MKYSELSSVFIVDDDSNLRDLLRSFFEFDGCYVTEAHNGLIAQNILKNQSFDLILCDINMPLMTGIELLEYCRKNQIRTKFILISGISEILEMQKASKMGADGFLHKPFNAKDLKDYIKTIVEEKTENPDSSHKKENFVPIHMDEFISSSHLISDIYVELSDNKYVKVAKEGDLIPQERMSQYKLRGLHYLYIAKHDFYKYLSFNIKLADLVKKTNKLSNKKKYAQLKHAVEVSLMDAFLEGVDRGKYGASKNIVVATIELINQEDNLVELLESLRNHSDLLFSHSIGVAMYSVLIARELNWTSVRNLGVLAMGGLYHDIGKKDFPTELLNKPRSKFTPEDTATWETHPIKGRDILMQSPGIPSEIIQVALHHHENLSGRGYPYKISGKSIHPFAKIVSLANIFCNYCLKTVNSEKQIDPQLAIDKILEYHYEEVSPKALVVLIQLFNMSPPKSLIDRAKEE